MCFITGEAQAAEGDERALVVVDEVGPAVDRSAHVVVRAAGGSGRVRGVTGLPLAQQAEECVCKRGVVGGGEGASQRGVVGGGEGAGQRGDQAFEPRMLQGYLEAGIVMGRCLFGARRRAVCLRGR